MKEICHDLHCRVDVPEEFLVAGAEIVEPPFAVGRPGESVLGALAVASEADTAISAVLRERIALGVSEILGHRTVG